METQPLTVLTFSQRMGLAEVKPTYQGQSMDRDLRTRLWNAVYEHFIMKLSRPGLSLKKISPIIRYIWTDFVRDKIDKIIHYQRIGPVAFYKWVGDCMFNAPFNRVFDFIEFLIPILESEEDLSDVEFILDCNTALEKEGSVFRIVNKKVVPLINGNEVMKLEQVFQQTATEEFAQTGFEKALALFTDRQHPDYNKVILEALQVVDWALARYPAHKISHDGLSPIAVHNNCMIRIREVLSEPGTVATFEEARYWLMVCAALVNYLKEKGGEE